MRYSKQRDAIYQYVKKSYDHPTALEVYKVIKKEMPAISLGTIYRNLNQLVEFKALRKLEMPNGNDRFDGTITNHCHIFCNSCSKVYDVDDNIVQNINILVNKQTGHRIIANDLVFIGICHECSK